MTSQPGDPTFQVDRIRGALLCTPEHRAMYMESARFKHDIDTLAVWLPMWVDAMATSARHNDQIQREVAAFMATAPQATFEYVPGVGKMIKPAGESRSLAELMDNLDTSMAEAKEARDRHQQPADVMHKVELGPLHNYQPPADDPDGPCTFQGCGLPGLPGVTVAHTAPLAHRSPLPRQEWVEPHDYVPQTSLTGAPCCHAPPDDAIHTLPKDTGLVHYVPAVPDDQLPPHPWKGVGAGGEPMSCQFRWTLPDSGGIGYCTAHPDDQIHQVPT